jgi:uncharacterized membrane protein YbhN (UPF0104 family)
MTPLPSINTGERRDAGAAPRLSAPWAYIAVSCVATLALAAWFASWIDLPLREALRRLAGADPAWLAAGLALTLLNGWFGAEKWRLCNRQVRGGPPSRLEAFGLTAVGMGLGQILPSQIAGALARAAGARIGGATTALRGGATTVFEQSFDVVVVFYLALATLAVHAAGGGEAMFWAAALVFGLIGLAATEGVFRLADDCLARLPAQGGSRLLRLARAVAQSGCADRALGRRLYILSLARFGGMVLIMAAAAQAIGVDIELWKIAAALPFGVIAIAVVATPGGVGANEAALTAALTAFGTPLEVALAWAIGARFIVLLTGLCVGGFGVAIIAGLAGLRRRRA